ncbi:MAG: hypothetical protein R2828_21620 [Saprospiraceae bacterium]
MVSIPLVKPRDPRVQCLPHKGPALMVDEVIAYAPASVKARLTVLPQNIYVRAGQFQVAGLIEHIAQTVALYKGMEAQTLQQEGQKGYLTAIRKLTVEREIPVGAIITTEIFILMDAKTAIKAKSITRMGGQLIGTSEMLFMLKSRGDSPHLS